MKILKKNSGFTLIETLVSINLSFIAISLIFSFYLFAQRFSESLSRNYMDKYVQISFFNNLQKTLNNSDKYVIIFIEDRISIITSNEDSIFIFKNSISINGILELINLDSVNISSSTDTENNLIQWSNGVLTNINFETDKMQSNEIHIIMLKIKRNDRNYSYQIVPLPNAASRFINISNPNSYSSY